MSDNSTVIAALEAALAANPDDVSLLLHLAKLLAQSDDGAVKALTYYQKVLAQKPVDTDALTGAYELACRLDNLELAAGYKQLLQGLGALPDDDATAPSVEGKVAVLPTAQTPASAAPTERVRGAGLRLVQEGDKADDFVEMEESHVYLDDVGGMEEVKRRLNLAFLAPLKNPELMQAYGKSVSGGLMLYGPPGCGKTFIARALAGELGAKFINIGLTDILDMYVGESERKLHELFELARRNGPAVLFIDELDAMGQKRSQLRHSGMRSLVNQLLSEMDSIGSDNDQVFILAATNHPWDVDTALRRPGRFDRIVAVLPPDQPARESILSYHLKKKPAEQIDVAALAAQTAQFSGADLAHLCESAVECAIEESLSTGNMRSLRQSDFDKPLQEVRASTLGWFESARNYAMFANEGGAYDDLLEYIRQHKL